MIASPRPVSRRYDSGKRRAQAQHSQQRIRETAEQLFLRDGYAATTMAAIAAAAEVSVETIYKSFGGKPGLVRVIQQLRLAGAGSIPAPDRSDEISAQDLRPRAVLRAWATLTGEVAPLVAPIVLLVRSAAATDVEMAALLEEINEQRLERMRHNARRLVERGPLRPGVSVDYVAGVLLAYSAAELYELLIIRQGWTLDEYADFVFRGMAAQLLDP